ncbi:MAG TPA: ABC-2 transporter permease [Planctomycetota bacterium]|nr:ABC-2 transporter permease [Planctomycetota bacterium]
MARTNTEVYRPFRGTLGARTLGFLALARAGIAAATKRKLPLVILFGPPAIATVIFSFVVYARFALEAGVTPSPLGGPSPASMIAVGFAKQMIQVREEIFMFHLAMSLFTLLVIAWFGAGLIADDRRLGAHLLYFARPLSRSGYLAAKFLTVLFFGGIAVVAPGLVICIVATFASPDFAFLRDEGSLIPRTILFGTLWAGVWGSVMLAISSLFLRKTLALVASFAFFMITTAISVVLANLQQDDRFLMLSLQMNMQRIAGWMLDGPSMRMHWDVRWSFAVVLGITAAAWAILFARVRRLEASA